LKFVLKWQIFDWIATEFIAMQLQIDCNKNPTLKENEKEKQA
jgi:hypothetical protein